jgi:hypothetical protein
MLMPPSHEKNLRKQHPADQIYLVLDNVEIFIYMYSETPSKIQN